MANNKVNNSSFHNLLYFHNVTLLEWNYIFNKKKIWKIIKMYSFGIILFCWSNMHWWIMYNTTNKRVKRGH